MTDTNTPKSRGELADLFDTIHETARDFDEATGLSSIEWLESHGVRVVPVNWPNPMVEAFYRAYERPLSPDRWESPFSNGLEAALAASPFAPEEK